MRKFGGDNPKKATYGRGMNQTHPDWDGIAAGAADMAVDLLGDGPRDGSCLSEAQKVAVF